MAGKKNSSFLLSCSKCPTSPRMYAEKKPSTMRKASGTYKMAPALPVGGIPNIRFSVKSTDVPSYPVVYSPIRSTVISSLVLQKETEYQSLSILDLERGRTIRGLVPYSVNRRPLKKSDAVNASKASLLVSTQQRSNAGKTATRSNNVEVLNGKRRSAAFKFGTSPRFTKSSSASLPSPCAYNISRPNKSRIKIHGAESAFRSRTPKSFNVQGRRGSPPRPILVVPARPEATVALPRQLFARPRTTTNLPYFDLQKFRKSVRNSHKEKIFIRGIGHPPPSGRPISSRQTQNSRRVYRLYRKLGH